VPVNRFPKGSGLAPDVASSPPRRAVDKRADARQRGACRQVAVARTGRPEPFAHQRPVRAAIREKKPAGC